MAFYAEFRGAPVEARARAVQLAIRKAEQSTGLKYPQDLLVRPLRPNDLGNLGGTWETLSVGTTLSELHNLALANNTWLVVYGIHLNRTIANEAATAADRPVEWRVNRSMAVEDIQRFQIARAGRTSREWTINMIPTFINKSGWVDDPIIVGENENITTSLVAQTASTLDGRAYAILGDIVEKRGLVINP